MIHLAILALLYFLPTIVASHRGHNVTGILILNLLLGWTIVGWWAILIWALCSTPRYAYHPYYPPNGWRRY